MAIGRISGQMLKSNLLRSGTDLAFETNLLVLDVTNSFVGIGTATPARQLHISGTGALRLPSGTDAERGTPANGDIRYNTDSGTIEGYSGGSWTSMVGEGIDNIVEDTTPQLGGDLDVNGQSIVTAAASNANINITPDGTGSVVMSKVDIDGGAIDGTVIGANVQAAITCTDLNASGSIIINDGTGTGIMDGVEIGTGMPAQAIFTSLTANGTIDIDSTGTGNIDNVVIGANTAAAGTFTTITTTGNATIGGDLIVNGTTTTIESSTLTIEDPLIQLAKNNSGGAANAFDQGLFFNRGSLDNVSFLWDESADEFVVAVTSGEDGTTAGNITIDSYANFRAGTITADLTGNVTGDVTGNVTGNLVGDVLYSDGSTVLVDVSAGSIVSTSFTANGTIDIDDGAGTGTMDGVIIGSNTAAAGTFTSVVTSSNITLNADSTALQVGADNDLQLTFNGTDSVITSITGNLALDGNTGNRIIVNSSSADVDFQVNGDTTVSLFRVDASAETVGIATTAPAYILDIGSSTDAVKLPNGDTATRPTASTGIIRFNTDTSKYEGSQDGSTFVNFQMEGDTPTISKDTATGDGSTTTFTGFFGSAPASANNVLVFIDNVYQEPTENYSVSGNNITFTSAPHSSARIFAISGFDNTAAATGGVARTQTASVSFESSATSIMSFNASTYRSAELFVTVTDSANTEYSAMKAVVIHDGTSAFITTYGITNTGASDTVTLTAEHDGSNTVSVKATSTGGSQTAQVQYSLQAV